MPEILKGVYYFDGNQAPKECDGPDSKMCRCAAAVPGAQCWERSPLMLMDYSYCKFGEAAVFGPGGIESAFATAKLVTPSPELLWNTDGKTYPVYCSFKEGIMGTSNAADGDWAAPGGKYIKILAALRAGYEIECGDETCTEASLYLSLAGMRISKFLKYKGGGAAKLTWEMKDGGKLMERREWDDIQGDPCGTTRKSNANIWAHFICMYHVCVSCTAVTGMIALDWGVRTELAAALPFRCGAGQGHGEGRLVIHPEAADGQRRQHRPGRHGNPEGDIWRHGGPHHRYRHAGRARRVQLRAVLHAVCRRHRCGRAHPGGHRARVLRRWQKAADEEGQLNLVKMRRHSAHTAEVMCVLS